MRRFNELYALFEELRRLKQVEMVEAEKIENPIRRAVAVDIVQERIADVEWKIEWKIEREMKG